MAKPRHPSHRGSYPSASDSYVPRSGSRIDSYRPQETRARVLSGPDQQRKRDTYRPGQDAAGDAREGIRHQDTPKLPPVRSAVTKTKHERNTNPSTRIHSLKRLLQTKEMPATVRQEKERELAALLFDQEQIKLKQNARKNLQRYHFVRFIERTKAERMLKGLRKQRDSCEDDGKREEIDTLIHRTEVDLNYAKYAPLGQKYIGLYPSDEAPRKKEKFQMDRLEFAVLDKQQQKDIRDEYDKAANVARNATGDKPPMWYEVERLMEQGETHLEALRDGKLTTGKQLNADLTSVGGKQDAQARSATGRRSEGATPDWLNDDGMIDPADLDSDQDEEMSDGGFFER